MLEAEFTQRLTTWLTYNAQLNYPAKRLVVAYSGGVDSTVLLHLCKQFVDNNVHQYQGLSLVAIHINHGLNDQADSWVNHCQTVCDDLSCSLIVRSVTLSSESAIEEQARNKRYQAFNNYCEAGDVLLTAHHMHDQSETLLFRFLRGAGSNGLQGIPESRDLDRDALENKQISVYRPLLSVSQTDILLYAEQNNLSWINDSSNQDLAFSRNFIRHDVLSLLRNRWPELDKNLSRSADFFRENQILLADLASIDMQACLNNDNAMLKWGDSIDLVFFCGLSYARQKNLLQQWISKTGKHLANEKRLMNLLSFIHGYERESSGEVTWRDGNTSLVFRVFEQRLFYHIYLFDNTELDLGIRHQEHMLDNSQISPQIFYRWEFTKHPEILWNSYRYRIEWISDNPAFIELNISTRQGGERCRPIGRNKSQSLKKLFQEYRIPPWERNNIPIFYHNERIIAVADYWVCDEVFAQNLPNSTLGSQQSPWKIIKVRV